MEIALPGCDMKSYLIMNSCGRGADSTQYTEEQLHILVISFYDFVYVCFHSNIQYITTYMYNKSI